VSKLGLVGRGRGAKGEGSRSVPYFVLQRKQWQLGVRAGGGQAMAFIVFIDSTKQ
jgi:hypothetical protein